MFMNTETVFYPSVQTEKDLYFSMSQQKQAHTALQQHDCQ